MAGAHLLIVDDDHDNCLVTQRLLTDQGYEVDAAYDALSRHVSSSVTRSR